MPPPSRSPSSFVEMLELIWWNLDKQLDEAMVRASGLVVAMEAARSGSTFVIDHHASPNAASGSLHVLAEAFDRVGVDHLLCYELSDRDGPERLKAGLEETDCYLKSHQGLVGLHASFTVSDPLLERAVDLANMNDTGVHIHVAEAESDEEHSRAQHGQSVIERLERAGALVHPQTILAHCLHLDDEERAQVDSCNNLVVLDYPSPTPVTAENWVGHMLYGVRSRHVHTVIRGGQVIVDAGRVVNVDEDEVLADARVQAARLWKKL